MRRLSAILLFVLVSATATSAGTLTVTGQGSVSAVPDMATMSLGVTQTEHDAKDAMSAAVRDANEMLAALRAEGLEEKDIQTGRVSLNPVWDYSGNRSRITGFTASISINVVLRDLDRIGEVLSVVTEIGGNRFGGFSLGLEDDSAMRSLARQEAVKDAMAKAQDYAFAAGVTLGDIMSINENGGGYGGPVPMMAMAEARSVDVLEVAAGETSVSQSVTLEIAFQ